MKRVRADLGISDDRLDRVLDLLSEALAHGRPASIARLSLDADVASSLRRELRRVLRTAGAWTDDVDDAITDTLAAMLASPRRDHPDRDPLLAELESRALLDEVLRQLPVGVSITDARTGQGLYHNAEAVRLTERDVTARKSLEDYAQYGAVHADGRRYAAEDYPTTRAIRHGEVVADEEMLYRLADGTVRTLVVSSRPLHDRDGNVVLVVTSFSEITERKRHEEQLRAMVAELHEERELRERFVAALTHDLRTPLGAAKMGAELLLRGTTDAARVQRLASRINDNIDRADAMIRDLLDVNLIRAGGTLSLERVAGDLVALVRGTLDELSSIHGNRFALRAPSPIPGAWDADAVRRIVENLCGNAVKYGTAQQPITVTLSADDDTATIAVHNAGEPIPAHELPQLFQMFRRADSARRGGVKGWGLGLALVKGLAEAHGGHASVTSSAERGTTFRVVLGRT
ncbi:MAG TPA: ATP-binding protein [Kofleriaceae bacterium]|nr:ATP-binding protein [Kofleriaceae bacterium]